MEKSINNCLHQEYLHTLSLIDCNLIDSPRSNSQVINIYQVSEISKQHQYEGIVEVRNEHTIEMALNYLKLGLKPLVLNMGSDRLPGGCSNFNGHGQEEELFRCTDLSKWLNPNFYPFEKECVIHSPKVTILKDHNHKILNNSPQIGILTVSAPRCPSTIPKYSAIKKFSKTIKKTDPDLEYQYVSHKRNMEAKINSIFKIALQYGYDSLVLGALGCGQYKNPVHAVVKLFQKSLLQYRKSFRFIGFAIMVLKPNDLKLFESFQPLIVQTL